MDGGEEAALRGGGGGRRARGLHGDRMDGGSCAIPTYSTLVYGVTKNNKTMCSNSQISTEINLKRPKCIMYVLYIYVVQICRGS